jgi:hypothetical protein
MRLPQQGFRRGTARRRRTDPLAWAIVGLTFVFAFALVLAPRGSLVLSPMEHAQRQAEARQHAASGAISGLAGAWEQAQD